MFIANNIFAQAPCVPGTITSPNAGYILPDSATNFVHGCAGKYYEQIVYIKAPKDTTITIFTLNIDSFIVNANIGGLPPYLTVESVPTLLSAVPSDWKRNFPHLRIKGDSLACVKISGNIPAAEPAGTTNLTINMRVFVGPNFLNITDTPASVGYYKFVIDAPGTGACLTANLKDFETSNFNTLNIIPNPSFGTTQLSFNAVKNGEATLKIINTLGATVVEQKLKLQAGLNHLPIDTKNLATGNYIIQLTDEKGRAQAKMLVQ